MGTENCTKMDLRDEIKELIGELDKKLKINSPQFEEQTKDAARLMGVWGRLTARSRFALHEAETKFDVWEAETYISCKTFLESKAELTKPLVKPTDTLVKAHVKKDQNYAKMRKMVNEAQYFVDLCEKAGYEPFKQQCYLLSVVQKIIEKTEG